MTPRIQQENPRPQPDLQQIQDAIASLATTFTEFHANQDQRHETHLLSIQTLQHQLQDLQDIQTTPQNQESSSKNSHLNNNNNHMKPPKLILLPFDRSNLLDWLFQADQYFTHYSINPNLHLSYIASYMSGDALAWFQWLHNSHLLTTWDRFTRYLELRFGLSSFENHQQALFKLKQSGSVRDYQKDFERLCNRVTTLPQSVVLDCFIYGLKPEIQHEMAIIRPTLISQAIGLAKLIEAKNAASKPYQHYTKNNHQKPANTLNSNLSNPSFPHHRNVWPYHHHHLNHPYRYVNYHLVSYKIVELKVYALIAMNASFRATVANRHNSFF